MLPLALPFPDIDPVALSLGPVSVKWYGLAYVAGLLLGWLYVKRLLASDHLWGTPGAPFKPDKTDDLLLWMTLGVVIGGRLGYVLFYDPKHYFANPLDIPQLWRGGMAFHGALLGSILVIYLFARRQKANPLSVLDVCAAATPIGLFFGRLANFINAELWGRPTDVPWAMVFPGAGPAARHPSQLYEAALEGLVLFLVLRWLTHSRLAFKRPGLVGGTFVAGYGLARSFCEFFREPDYGHALSIGPLTAGIAYSIPMIAVGAVFIWLALNRAKA